MYQQHTLPELAQQLERIRQSQADYIADQSKVTLLQGAPDDLDGDLVPTPAALILPGTGEFQVNDHTHGQLATHLGIPRAFYDRLRSSYPGEYNQVANALLRGQHTEAGKDTPPRRMVRTVDGTARAWLSDRYRILDSFDLLDAILPACQDSDLHPASCGLTDTRMYLKLVTDKLTAEPKVGDVVRGGVVISNSDVGAGSLYVYPFIETLACTNGMVVQDRATEGMLRKYHVGRRHDDQEANTWLVMSDEAKAAEDRAFFLKVRDVVKAAVSEEAFARAVRSISNAADLVIEGDPQQAVEVVADRVNLTEHERGGVMRHLIEGGDLSMWGFASAITRTAQDADNYDRATDLEVAGWQVLQLGQREWRQVATAGA